MQISRRSFLRYMGYGTGVLAAHNALGPLARPAHAQVSEDMGHNAWVGPDGNFDWEPVPYPLPHPGDGGSAETDAVRFADYEIRDDLVLPEGFRYDVIAQWGDRFGPDHDPARQIVFGFNADYTGLVPIDGSPDEYYLVVNHEYISGRPWLQGYATAHGRPLPPVRLFQGDPLLNPSGRLHVAGITHERSSLDLAGPATPGVDAAKAVARAGMEDLGISVLHVRREPDGRLEVVRGASDHRRFSGVGPVNADPGAPATFANCSGATTPWGTVLSCEENFQDQVAEWIDASGIPLPGHSKPFGGLGAGHATELPFEFEGLGQGSEATRDGRDFGWVVEVDPAAGTLTKVRSLGRFRHENVALRCEAGKPLVAYMGDDRRGGHVWKFVSRDLVTDPRDKRNSALLHDGTLYVAKLRADFTGEWLPLVPDQPLVRPEPQHLSSRHLWLPDRFMGGHVAVGVPPAKAMEMPVARWIASIERFTGKPYDATTLGDLVRPSGSLSTRDVLLLDAYVMGNAIGGTPCSRPEDIEVHPIDRSVYVAFTDSTGSDDGSPDVRIFPDSRGENSRQYGAIYRLVEDDNDPAATTFTWGKFVSSGEAGEGGGGFACADNLVFDPQGNLWVVTDISTPTHNAAITDRTNTPPGSKAFPGIFGNNALFVIPTAGPNAGVPYCFAIGPMECELTGPMFTHDGQTLILSVQHPGELNGTRGFPGVDQPAQEVREMVLATRDGKTTFVQRRTVPLGSNFPSGKLGEPPRPCVVCITRTG